MNDIEVNAEQICEGEFILSQCIPISRYLIDIHKQFRLASLDSTIQHATIPPHDYPHPGKLGHGNPAVNLLSGLFPRMLAYFPLYYFPPSPVILAGS